MTRQNNKTADRKMESNDSPEIPDRGETSEVPGLRSGPKNKGVRWLIVIAIFEVRSLYDLSFQDDGMSVVTILDRVLLSLQPFSA